MVEVDERAGPERVCSCRPAAFLLVVIKLGQQVRHESFQGPDAGHSNFLQGWRFAMYNSQSFGEPLWELEDRLHLIFSTDCTSFQHWQVSMWPLLLPFH